MAPLMIETFPAEVEAFEACVHTREFKSQAMRIFKSFVYRTEWLAARNKWPLSGQLNLKQRGIDDFPF